MQPETEPIERAGLAGGSSSRAGANCKISPCPLPFVTTVHPCPISVPGWIPLEAGQLDSMCKGAPKRSVTDPNMCGVQYNHQSSACAQLNPSSKSRENLSAVYKTKNYSDTQLSKQTPWPPKCEMSSVAWNKPTSFLIASTLLII